MSNLKMGHWIDCSNGWMCSVCHRDNTYDIDVYPNCGAKMRGKNMEYENISLGEAIEILEEVMELDDSIYAYNRKYRMALEFVIDCIKRDIDVKVEIEQKAYLDGFEGCAECVEKYLSDEDKKRLECLLSALRNSVAIDWGEESEADFPQTKDIEPTVENFSKVLDNKLIKDAIRDCETDIKGKIRCNTCKNNDDELSGECYECIKGIFDHYEPQESEEV